MTGEKVKNEAINGDTHGLPVVVDGVSAPEGVEDNDHLDFDTINGISKMKEDRTAESEEEVSAELEGDFDRESQDGADEKETSLAIYDPLRRYLWEIRKYPILSYEEEKKLAIRYKETGDPEAAYKLITSNLRLVVKIALEFQKHWMLNLMDLIQEGNIGLMQAVKKFDPYRGTRLSSYASFWIKAYILKFIMDNWRLVKIGTTQNQRKLFFNLKKEKERLDAMGFEPAPKLLAERLDVKEEEVIEMDQRLDGWEVSLESPVHEDSSTQKKDLIHSITPAADEELAGAELRSKLLEKLNEFKETLNERDRFIFENRILSDNPMTLQEIGDHFGITRERARQVEARLKLRVRKYLEEEIPELVEMGLNAIR